MTAHQPRAETAPSMAETRVYNTLTRRKEPLRTIAPGKVRMYVCGVTPYDSAHVGHGMSLISFDVIRRYLEHRGYEVRHIQNFTDIDDKIINRANVEGIDPDELTERYIAEWHAQMRDLNVLAATHYPRATEEVGPIIDMVQGLIDRGHAYAVDGNVYFRVRSFAGYGKLSHRDLDDLLAGARIEVDERKEDPLDFALWKSAKPGEPSWESPWGLGRPGWHIECSAMSSTYLDGQVDIHGGGADLIFPHHENEIAQSEAFLGVEPFARYWIHNGLVRVGDEKMSKSLGNFVRLKEIVERGLGPAFRLMILQSHYRVPLTYTEEGLLAAERGLSRLRAAADPAPSSVAATEDGIDATTDLAALAEDVRCRFHQAMDDDFNAPEALAALFDLARAINRARGAGEAAEGIKTARGTLVELAGVLGLDLEDDPAAAAADAAPFIDLLLRIREELRQRREWALSDLIRDELGKLEVVVEDTPSGATWTQRRG
ncbi:MAG TPA: cysteine--tRNA ligase [Thermomicrobiales bacterium]|nr:cysteine--tRNA ligase [Thermomicrobiales bacterium]